MERLAISDIPSDESLVPASRVDQVLILWIFVELGAVDSVGVAIVGSVRFLEFYHLLPLYLIIDAYNRLAASSHQFGAVMRVVQTVELLVNGGRVVLDGG